LISSSDRTATPAAVNICSARSTLLGRRIKATFPSKCTAEEYAYSMFMPPSPKIFVIFESGFCSEMKVAVTSVFFFDLARLNSASSRSFGSLLWLLSYQANQAEFACVSNGQCEDLDFVFVKLRHRIEKRPRMVVKENTYLRYRQTDTYNQIVQVDI